MSNQAFEETIDRACAAIQSQIDDLMNAPRRKANTDDPIQFLKLQSKVADAYDMCDQAIRDCYGNPAFDLDGHLSLQIQRAERIADLQGIMVHLHLCCVCHQDTGELVIGHRNNNDNRHCIVNGYVCEQCLQGLERYKYVWHPNVVGS